MLRRHDVAAKMNAFRANGNGQPPKMKRTGSKKAKKLTGDRDSGVPSFLGVRENVGAELVATGQRVSEPLLALTHDCAIETSKTSRKNGRECDRKLNTRKNVTCTCIITSTPKIRRTEKTASKRIVRSQRWKVAAT